MATPGVSGKAATALTSAQATSARSRAKPLDLDSVDDNFLARLEAAEARDSAREISNRSNCQSPPASRRAPPLLALEKPLLDKASPRRSARRPSAIPLPLNMDPESTADRGPTSARVRNTPRPSPHPTPTPRGAPVRNRRTRASACEDAPL